MRVLLNKRSSTKAERIFSEILKRNHIPYEYSVVIEGKEIDFIIGKYAIEIDGHEQSPSRNAWILTLGLVPVHYTNHIMRTNRSAVENDIISKIWLSFQKQSVPHQ